jgi:RNA polymerase sigma factor (sigma-70 family)
VSADVSDGDLARLARDGDPVAFRLLVERHQPMVRARARELAPDPGDVDDIMQESFLQAFLALDRLRDPDRFAGWLAGIVLNVCRGLRRRRAPVTLLGDWPEPLHPASAGGLPPAEDLDRADALRAAVASLPAGQRRAVTLHYYADVPAGQVAEPPGAARASLHKARLRLRAYLTEHRPDLVPAPGRTHMTTVRVARFERRIPRGPVPDRLPTHVIVLADDAGHRDLPIWLLGGDSHVLDHPGPLPHELTDRLLHAAGARVAAVDIDELGPEVTAARIEVATAAGTEHVTASLADGLIIAVTTAAPVRVADAVMDRLAVPARPNQNDAGQGGPIPEQTARALPPSRRRPRYEPRNMAFAAGLDDWWLSGSFVQNAIASHWQDYSSAADDGAAVLAAAVPQPEGFAFLAQTIYADDYRGAEIVFRGQVRVPLDTDLAGLFLRVRQPHDADVETTGAAALANPANHIVTVEDRGDWTSRQVAAQIPADTDTIVFGVFLAGPGQIQLRDPQLTRAGLAY